MPINFNLEGLEEKDKREIKYLLQTINDTLEGGIWHTNIKEGAIILTDRLFNTKVGTEALHSNITGYNNLAFGYQTLYSNTGGYDNLAIGHQALYFNMRGYENIAIGYRALYSNASITGRGNIAIGKEALYLNATGNYNIAIGWRSLRHNLTGIDNVAIGSGNSLRYNTGGWDNVAVGEYSLGKNTTGDGNIALGYGAGYYNTTGDNNVFIGYDAGNQSGPTDSYKLYINDGKSATPLIYGEFDNDLIAIYGNLGIGTKTFGTSATRTLAMLNGTVPSTSPANAIQLYAEDVTASSELKVRDEATNVTTLSPHNFELFKPKVDDPFPWSYHSINQLIGKKVNADISGALRELENLTGKKFLYYEDVNKISLDEYMEEKKEQLITNYIAENGTEVEVEKGEAWGEVEVEVQDIKEITGYDTKYEFDEKTGKVKEIKKPKYGKKTVLKNKLKKEYRFNEETGKFLKKIKPTEEEAEKEIKKELVIPKWIEDRLEI